MSDVVKKVSLEVGAKNDTSAGLGAVEASVKTSFDRIEAEARRHHSRLKANLDRLEETVGNRSSFKKIGDLLAGQGPLIGIGIAGALASEFTTKLDEGVTSLAMGEKSISQILDEAVRAVPIAGSIYTTAYNLADIVTGTSLSLAEANHELAIANTRSDLLKDTWSSIRGIVRDINKERVAVEQKIDDLDISHRKAELTKIGADKAFPSALKLIDVEAAVAGVDKALAAIDGQTRERIKAFRRDPNRTADIKALQKDIDDQRANLPDQTITIAGGPDEFATVEHNPKYDEAQAKLTADIARLDKLIEAGRKGEGHIRAAERDMGESLQKQRAKMIADFNSETGENFADGLTGIVAKSVEKAVSAVPEQFAGFKLAVDEAVKKSMNVDETRQAGIGKILSDIDIDTLHTRADLGDAAAGREAESLAIHEKYVSQQKQLNDLLADQNLSLDDQLRVKAQLATLSTREADEQRVALSKASELQRLSAIHGIPTVGTGFGSLAKFAAEERYARNDAIDIIAPGLVSRLRNASTADANAKAEDKVVKAINDLGKTLVDKLGGKVIRTLGS